MFEDVDYQADDFRFGEVPEAGAQEIINGLPEAHKAIREKLSDTGGLAMRLELTNGDTHDVSPDYDVEIEPTDEATEFNAHIVEKNSSKKIIVGKIAVAAAIAAFGTGVAWRRYHKK